MAKIIIHEIPFQLADGLDLTPGLEAHLERAARDHLSRKIIVAPWPGEPGRHSVQFADESDLAAGYPETKVLIDGIECGILAFPGVTITDDDVSAAKSFWLDSPYVEPIDESDGKYFIDFIV